MTSSSKALRYLIGGLLIGAMWYINRGRPAWEEALRTIAVFTVLMAILKGKLRGKGVVVRLVPLVASKAVLVVIAAVVQTRIDGSTDNAALIVAVGLALAVALLGPLGDSHYFTRAAAGAPAPAAVRPGQRY